MSGASNSSERRVTTDDGAHPVAQSSLSNAHHFVSIKLTSQNFLFWRIQLVPFLKGQELLGFIDGETLCPPLMIKVTPSDSSSAATTFGSTPNPAYRAWVKQDQSLLSLLISSLSDEVMYLAVGKTTSREVWESIGTAPGCSTRARCLSLLGQFHALWQGNATAAEYLGRAQLLVEALAHAGRPVSLDEQNLFVLCGLCPEFRSMASSLTAAGRRVTIPQIGDYLQAQEFIHADDFSTGVDGGLLQAPSAMYAGRGRHGEGGRENFSNPGRGSQGRGQNGSNWCRGGRGSAPRCQICRAQGHTALYCYKRYAPAPPAQANLVVSGEDAATTTASASGWFPDTGATAHATPDQSMLAQSDEYNGGDVLRVGNGAGFNNQGGSA
ncbi:PREDICTED: uncharacterized protein LOC109148906 [Ipomoea nil]|uniref:uncharacterized protein LOC109148906 n=1 Tax=Ipomoea nil TaxID=35883 RepID=UPI000901B607|nr:PREDICTED: uncharacterized protein LOC109148906 [Ipomoea nil]